MTAPAYTVQADVFDIRRCTPQAGGTYLVDSNVLFWMTYTRMSQVPENGPSRYQSRDYAAFIKRARPAPSRFVACGMSFAELAHAIERAERDIFNATKGASLETKDFRHNYADARAKVVEEIEAPQMRRVGMSSSKIAVARELIQEATLEQLHCDRFGAERLVIGQAPRQLKINFEFGGTGRITSPSTFEASVVFGLLANGEDGAGVAKLNCTMVLKYRVRPGVSLSDAAVTAFAETNGVFNAWPYFREYVQSGVQRLGMGIALTLPLLRFSELTAMRASNAKPAGGTRTKRRA